MEKSIKILFPIFTATVIFTGCSISEPPTAQSEQNQVSELATSPSSSTADKQQQQPTEDKQQEQPAEDQKSKEATG